MNPKEELLWSLWGKAGIGGRPLNTQILDTQPESLAPEALHRKSETRNLRTPLGR